MLKSGDRHLTEDEIERLSGGLVTSESTSAVVGSPEESVAQHLSRCLDCQRQVGRRKEVNERLEALRAVSGEERRSDCPSDEEWMNLAAGITDKTRSDELLEHAAGCDHCGLEMKSAYDILARDATAEESDRLAGLESAKPQWRKRLIDRLAQQPAKGSAADSRTDARPAREDRRLTVSSWWHSLSPAWRLVIPALACAGLIIAGWFQFRPASIADADRLLAEAYSERRLIEVRIPGAKYARITEDRGEENEPQALKDVNSLIGHKLIAHPDDPVWLDARGRAELIALRYDAAVETLSRAANLEPDSAPIMTDLGTALYLRANGNDGRKVDYGTAIEYFSRALATSPDDPIALFNRALANNAMHFYEPAMEDWSHYLRIDPAGDWSNEARKKLDEVQDKVKNKKSSLQAPLLAPAQASQRTPAELEEEIEPRAEEYLQLSGKEWLPRAFPGDSRAPAGEDALKLLQILARVTRDRHDDLWLTDLLETPHQPGFNVAVSHLAAAKKAIEVGNYAEGRKEAGEARLRFRSAGSIAGELQAETDEMYSYHLLYDGQHCVQLAEDLAHRLAFHRYRWLQAQATLEAANCGYLTGDLGNARAALERGTSEAKDSHYAGLYLRGLGFLADSAASIGDPKKGFVLASAGLDSFWSGPGDLMKGYNLYTDLDTAADDLRLPNLQLAIWRQATALIDLHPDLVQRAMAHRWFGNSAYLANRPDIAEREFASAGELFAESPQTEATARGEMDAEIWLAALEARKGDSSRAAARLEAVRPRLIATPSFATELGFYTTEADLSLRRNDPQKTELALRSAVFLAEWALDSLASTEDRREWVSQTDRTYRTLVWWKIHQGDSKAALELWEWYKGAEYRIRNAGTVGNSRLHSAAPPDARQALPIVVPTTVSDQLSKLRGKSVVTYVRFDDGLAAWLYDDRGIFFHWIPPAQLEASATRFERLCSTRGSDLSALRAVARSLHQMLIGPLEVDMERDRALAFELDGVLSAIPMEALVDETGHYLVEQKVLVTTPGIYQSLHFRPGSAVTRASPALVVSAPVTADDGFAPLLDAESEAKDVADSFHSSKWLNGSAATLTAIRLGLTNSVIFHFAGHAAALPERSGLLLAQVDPQTERAVYIGADSFATANIKNLQLAVLSACDTWPAAQSMSSGTEDLTKSLLRAGVPHVVASRWRVDSNETAELMRNFYGQLLAGNDVSSSLRAAQLKLASETESVHPYYWAAFGVQGTF